MIDQIIWWSILIVYLFYIGYAYYQSNRRQRILQGPYVIVLAKKNFWEYVGITLINEDWQLCNVEGFRTLRIGEIYRIRSQSDSIFYV